MAVISTLKFNKDTPNNLKKIKYGSDWPVVYIINNNDEAYVGETTDISIRSNQHLSNEVRKKLTTINIISDYNFNKSSILDLESFLIKFMSADGRFKLQNGNGGLQNHNYYNKDDYEKSFRFIWSQLKQKKLVNNELRQINNSDLFKYSPYKSLSTEQYIVVNKVLNDLAFLINLNRKGSFIIDGGAGTGKTVLGIYLLKLICDSKDSSKIEIEEDQVEQNLSNILRLNDAIDDLKIAMVIPMKNLRCTLKKVFKSIPGLKSSMVLSPYEVGKNGEEYDLLIIDEAHRLRRRCNLPNYGTFDSINNKYNLGKTGTELDWIMLNSKYQIFLYDKKQSIRPTDIRKEAFENINASHYKLETQVRCLAGGDAYVEYVTSILSSNPPKKKKLFKEYDLKLFDDIKLMTDSILKKDSEYGLCRNIAGYAWKWKSKGKGTAFDQVKTQQVIDSGIFDIDIDGNKYIWNSKAVDWINSPNSVNEIGSIHTTQGFDLNYAGVIIGNDLKYDKLKNKIYINKNSYYDLMGKQSVSDEELLDYVLNIYRTMMLRGMLGTYIYVCDPGLREYLRKYIDTYKI